MRCKKGLGTNLITKLMMVFIKSKLNCNLLNARQGWLNKMFELSC